MRIKPRFMGLAALGLGVAGSVVGLVLARIRIGLDRIAEQTFQETAIATLENEGGIVLD